MQDTQRHICIPKQLQERAIMWYHRMLMHPGETCMELTMAYHYIWKGMRKTVVCSCCDSCHKNKRWHPKLGILNPKNPELVPWETVCIDLIGPYTISKVKYDKDGKQVISDTHTYLHTMTKIDPTTGWFEIMEIPNKWADKISNLFEQVWLAHYPWLAKVMMPLVCAGTCSPVHCTLHDHPSISVQSIDGGLRWTKSPGVCVVE